MELFKNFQQKLHFAKFVRKNFFLPANCRLIVSQFPSLVMTNGKLVYKGVVSFSFNHLISSLTDVFSHKFDFRKI